MEFNNTELSNCFFGRAVRWWRQDCCPIVLFCTDLTPHRNRQMFEETLYIKQKTQTYTRTCTNRPYARG